MLKEAEVEKPDLTSKQSLFKIVKKILLLYEAFSKSVLLIKKRVWDWLKKGEEKLVTHWPFTQGYFGGQKIGKWTRFKFKAFMVLFLVCKWKMTPVFYFFFFSILNRLKKIWPCFVTHFCYFDLLKWKKKYT